MSDQIERDEAKREEERAKAAYWMGLALEVLTAAHKATRNLPLYPGTPARKAKRDTMTEWLAVAIEIMGETHNELQREVERDR